MKSFGKMIEEACRQQGVTQSELARALGHSPAWAAHVMRGNNMTERVFKECARVLDLDVRVELVPMTRARQRITARRQARETAEKFRLRSSNGK
jgi:transcriptional regulator with XRE-family HTH domain